MSLYEVVSRRLWAQNRLGLQLNPLQIPLVMDTSASKQLCTGIYKLNPPLIVKRVKDWQMYRWNNSGQILLKVKD